MLSVAAACVAVAVCPTGAGVAQAQTDLPPVGAEISSSMLATGSIFEIRSSTLALDLRGGIKQRVVEDPDDPVNSVRLRTVGFKLSAQIGDGDGDGGGGGGGSITFQQSDIDTTAPSTLRLTQTSPARYEEKDLLDFSVTIEQPDGEPLVLQAKSPMVLTAELAQYPADGEMFRLEEPVEFVDLENPETVVARLTAFPCKRGRL